MKSVFTSPDSGQVAFVRSVLDAAELPYEVRNQSVSQVIAASIAFGEEIWVRDEDFDEARELIAASIA